MGHLAISDMLAHTDPHRALKWHLQHNHYPPVPPIMVPTCWAAITAAADGDWEAEISLPDGVTYRGSATAPAAAIVEQHHLLDFVDIAATDQWATAVLAACEQVVEDNLGHCTSMGFSPAKATAAIVDGQVEPDWNDGLIPADNLALAYAYGAYLADGPWWATYEEI